MRKSFILYSVYVKKYYQPTAEFVTPIQVGKSLSQSNLLILGDDTGYTISHLYPEFGELTALYWIWLNANHQPTDAWGFCHYRRYFSLPKPRIFGPPKMVEHAMPSAMSIDGLLRLPLLQHMRELLAKADAITSVATPLSSKSKTIEADAVNNIGKPIWQIFVNTFGTMHPNMVPALQRFIGGQQSITYHMMVAQHQFWAAYLAWLFPILFEVQHQVGTLRQTYERPLYAYLGEMLMNVYLEHQQPKLATMPITVFDKK